MTRRGSDHGLEFLLAFGGRLPHLEKGYWLKFELTRVEATKNRPHGLSYSFTVSSAGRDETGRLRQRPRVSPKGSRFKYRGETTDHWHRTEEDPGRPYHFGDAEALIDDFFNEVERVLRDRGVGLEVIRTETSRRSK